VSAKTGIEWTDATWNPIRGCSRVSEGCRNCYAEKVAYRFSGPGQPYEGLVGIFNGTRKPVWNGSVRFVEKHLLDPLTDPEMWKPVSVGLNGGHPTRSRRIFVNSMSDLFHENVPDEWIDKIFAVMALCPQHTFQVLTKRPKRMLEYFASLHRAPAEARAIKTCAWVAEEVPRIPHAWIRLIESIPRGLPNVWLGVSVEDQKTADERIPLLLQTPAAVRFISAEPLLAEVDLTVIPREPSTFDRALAGFNRCKGFFVDAIAGSNGALMIDGTCHEEPIGAQSRLDWVIVGGESGPGARPMHPDWVRSLRDQCVTAKVPFFFKQWGNWEPTQAYSGTRDNLHTWTLPRHQMMQRVGKHAAGASLDGREWREFPA